MNVDYKIADIKDTYLALFEENRETIFASTSDFVNQKREEAIKRFEQLGFPGKKAEDYKYTNIREIFDQDYIHSFFPQKIEFKIEDIFTCDIPDLDTRVIILLNGFYHNPEEKITRLPNGIVFGSMSAASREFPGLFREHYGKHADFQNNGITALNTSFAQDGIFIHVPDNVRTNKPLQIIHLLMTDKPQMVHHRNLFIMGENSEASIVICDHTLSSHNFLTNSVTEIIAEKNCRLDLTRVQNEHDQSSQITNAYIHQKEQSTVTSNYITLHGGTVRNNLEVTLDGERAENHSLGIFLADKKQHVDNFTLIKHMRPNCMSNQLYKAILDDDATGAFNGRIYVDRAGQKTVAYQKSNNILLSDNAKVHSKPQLEIYADDVKCSHGATIGQLDEEALFYLRSRGIPEKESRMLMLYAFSHEVISAIKVPALKERIDELIDKRLRGELSRCNNCNMRCS